MQLAILMILADFGAGLTSAWYEPLLLDISKAVAPVSAV